MKIEKQFAIIEKQVGWYHAFPTLAYKDGIIWLACRSGKVDKHQCHGSMGCVRLFEASAAEADCWRDKGVLFSPSPTGSRNELDAIISAPTPELVFLATRDFEYGKRNKTFLSRCTGFPCTERFPLAEISDRPVICFGHIRQTVNGELLMSGYGGTKEEPQAAPYLLVSTDQGDSWRLRAKVASSEAAGTRLTEFSLGHLEGTAWTTLIRSETPPFFLHRSETPDDGRSWSAPQPTDLKGHAPMLIEIKPSGKLLVLYRDLSGNRPGIGIGCSRDGGKNWQRIGSLAFYEGSIYDGGYGDLIQLEASRFLAVYYLCDQDASPWIEGAIFTIENNFL